jgi:hypothetical protein
MPPLSDGDVRRYLAARADAVAERGGGVDMAERVAVEVGLVRPGFQGRTQLLRVAVVVAVLAGLLAVAFGTGVPPPRPTPTPTPNATPSTSALPVASPATLAALASVGFADTGSVAATDDAVWVADRSGRLAELDPTSGAVLRTVTLPRVASGLLLTGDSVWVASATGDLLRVDRTSLGITAIPGAVGVALTSNPDAVWLGGTDEVIRIDPATNAVSLRVPVPNRSADLGIAIVGDGVWVGTRAEIVRLSAADGSVTARIAGDASRLAFGAGFLWAIRGTELLRIDPATTAIQAFIPGMPTPAELVAKTDRIWVAGPAAGGPVGTVVGVSVTTDVVEFVSATVSVRGLAVGRGTIWLVSDSDADPGTIHRFATP